MDEIAPPVSLDALLEQFHRTHHVRRRTIDGVEWTWTSGGSGHDAILLLPGALGLGEMMFHIAVPLGADYRVVIITYPAVPTFGALIDGIVAILSDEGFDITDPHGADVHVIGASYGGMVAQVLARAHPTGVASLVLSSTGVPDASRIKTTRRVLSIVPRMPLAVFRVFIRVLLRVLTRELGAAASFWRPFYQKLTAQLTTDDIAASYARVIEFDAMTFSPSDLPALAGHVLILETADDPLIKRGVGQALRALYPTSLVHTFAKGGHGTSIANAEEYVAMVRRFIG